MRKATVVYLTVLVALYVAVTAVLFLQGRNVQAAPTSTAALTSPKPLIDNPDCPSICSAHPNYDWGSAECWCQVYKTLCFIDTCSYSQVCKCKYYQCHGSWPYYSGRQCQCTGNQSGCGT